MPKGSRCPGALPYQSSILSNIILNILLITHRLSSVTRFHLCSQLCTYFLKSLRRGSGFWLVAACCWINDSGDDRLSNLGPIGARQVQNRYIQKELKQKKLLTNVRALGSSPDIFLSPWKGSVGTCFLSKRSSICSLRHNFFESLASQQYSKVKQHLGPIERGAHQASLME